MSGNPISDFLQPSKPKLPDQSELDAERKKEDAAAEQERERTMADNARRRGRLATLLAGEDTPKVKLGKSTVLGQSNV